MIIISNVEKAASSPRLRLTEALGLRGGSKVGAIDEGLGQDDYFGIGITASRIGAAFKL
jgi:hypothetical protein